MKWFLRSLALKCCLFRLEKILGISKWLKQTFLKEISLMTFSVSLLLRNHSDTFIHIRMDAVYITYAPSQQSGSTGDPRPPRADVWSCTLKIVPETIIWTNELRLFLMVSDVWRAEDLTKSKWLCWVGTSSSAICINSNHYISTV